MSAGRVLVVEDDDAIRELVRESLESLGGFSVTTCASGEEALRVAGRVAPDVLVLDMLMPGMTGMELMRRMQADASLAATPVLFLTARTQGHEVAQYRELGAADVLAKPFDPMELCARVAAVRARANASAPQAPSAARRVIVVEDDPGVRYLVEFVLAQAGLAFEFLRDGREARGRIAGAQPDLVVLDVSLPDDDGLDILQYLRTRGGWKAVPVLMLSAQSGEDIVARAFALGATDYLVKPFDPAELAARVSRLLDAPTR